MNTMQRSCYRRLHLIQNKGLRFFSSLFWLMSVIVLADNEFALSLLLPLRAFLWFAVSLLDDTFFWLPLHAAFTDWKLAWCSTTSTASLNVLLWCVPNTHCEADESTCFSTQHFWQHLVNSPSERAGLCSSSHQHAMMMLSPVCPIAS